MLHSWKSGPVVQSDARRDSGAHDASNCGQFRPPGRGRMSRPADAIVSNRQNFRPLPPLVISLPSQPVCPWGNFIIQFYNFNFLDIEKCHGLFDGFSLPLFLRGDMLNNRSIKKSSSPAPPWCARR